MQTKQRLSRLVQVAMYGLLLEARYGVPALDGLLWYSSDDAMQRTSLKPQDIAGELRLQQRTRMSLAALVLPRHEQ